MELAARMCFFHAIADAIITSSFAHVMQYATLSQYVRWLMPDGKQAKKHSAMSRIIKFLLTDGIFVIKKIVCII